MQLLPKVTIFSTNVSLIVGDSFQRWTTYACSSTPNKWSNHLPCTFWYPCLLISKHFAAMFFPSFFLAHFATSTTFLPKNTKILKPIARVGLLFAALGRNNLELNRFWKMMEELFRLEGPLFRKAGNFLQQIGKFANQVAPNSLSETCKLLEWGSMRFYCLCNFFRFCQAFSDKQFFYKIGFARRLLHSLLEPKFFNYPVRVWNFFCCHNFLSSYVLPPCIQWVFGSGKNG